MIFFLEAVLWELKQTHEKACEVLQGWKMQELWGHGGFHQDSQGKPGRLSHVWQNQSPWKQPCQGDVWGCGRWNQSCNGHPKRSEKSEREMSVEESCRQNISRASPRDGPWDVGPARPRGEEPPKPSGAHVTLLCAQDTRHGAIGFSVAPPGFDLALVWALLTICWFLSSGIELFTLCHCFLDVCSFLFNFNWVSHLSLPWVSEGLDFSATLG